jgi:quercetin dioxygenase-like cupin family protein
MTKRHFIGGVYAAEFHIKAGERFLTHRHKHDHMSILVSGIAQVSTGSETRTYQGPEIIEIKAGTNHGLEAITDVAWFCIHAVDPTSPGYVHEDANEMIRELVEG